MLSMKIAIADDDLCVCQKIREFLLVYSTQKDVDMEPPDIYTNCEALFQAYLNGAQYDFLFLDIDFSGNGKLPDFSRACYPVDNDRMNGITFASRLRRTLGHLDVDIIYVSSHENCAVDTIPVRPAGFIQKPVTLEKVLVTMDTTMQYRELTHRVFTFNSNKSHMHIQVSRIQYLNSCGRQVIIKMVDSKVSFYGKLSEVKKQKCFASFLCIHKSYLVNPDYIERFTANAVYLRGHNHESLPISRTQQPIVDDWLMKG